MAFKQALKDQEDLYTFPSLAHDLSSDQQMTVSDVMQSEKSKPDPKKSDTQSEISLDAGIDGLTESELQQMLVS